MKLFPTVLLGPCSKLRRINVVVPDAQAVSGTGDRALWSHREIGSGFDILKSGRLVQMGLPRSIVALTPEVEKAAKLVASRM